MERSPGDESSVADESAFSAASPDGNGTPDNQTSRRGGDTGVDIEGPGFVAEVKTNKRPPPIDPGIKGAPDPFYSASALSGVQPEPPKPTSSSQSASLDQPAREKRQPRRQSRVSTPPLVVGRVASELDPSGSSDHLGIDQDARALAALIASRSMQPPLAIGVYGEWGSGKTFLMHRIEHWVSRFQTEYDHDPAGPFERRIASVWFNAWHYSAADSDASLWASLVSHIFATLNTDGDGIDKKVIEQVDAARRISDELDNQLTEARDVESRATDLVNAAKKDYASAVEAAADVRAEDIYAAIDSAELKEWNGQIHDAAQTIGIEQVAGNARELAAQTHQLIELGNRATVLATAGKWWKSPLALAIYALIIVIGGAYAAQSISQWHEFSLALAQFAAICTAAAAWIARSSALIQRILKPAEAVQQKIDDRVEEARRDQLRLLAEAEGHKEAAAVQVEALTRQRAEALAAVAAAEAERDGMNGPELLRRYLAERAGSHDYDRYMGVVALAKNDLEQLSKHLTRARTASEDSEIRRIVLYIDDLDRCSPPVVSNVLAAVHLLLSLPLFTVVVGVDPRWLHTSLSQTHTELFPRAQSRPSATTTNDYLEKIFQLTFTLPAMTSSGYSQLVTATLDSVLASTTNQSAGSPPPTASESAEIIQTTAALTLTAGEKVAISAIAPFVARTPRGTKRFLSMYLVIRARAFAEHDAGSKKIDGKSNGLLLLVALMLGVPNIVPQIPRDPESEITFSEWLDQNGGIDGAQVPMRALSSDDLESLRRLRAASAALFDAPLTDVVAWQNIAAPYTNSELRITDREMDRRQDATITDSPRAAKTR